MVQSLSLRRRPLVIMLSAFLHIISATLTILYVERDTDYYGGDLDVGGFLGRVNGNMATFEECKLACIALPDCKSLTWIKSETTRDNCSLKTRTRDTGEIRSGEPCCDSVDMSRLSPQERNQRLIDAMLARHPVGVGSFVCFENFHNRGTGKSNMRSGEL